MAQHIGLKILNESKGEFRDTSINFASIINYLYTRKDFQSEFPYLQLIDPYKDTKIKGDDIIGLINDLKKLGSSSLDIKKECESLIVLLSQITDGETLLFIGD